jgi:hypothetical protein
MSLSFVDISAHPNILPLISKQSSALVATFLYNPRLSSIFATQQRWLLAHAAMALAFREGGAASPRMTLARFLDEAQTNGLASRNTADAFIKEMLHYGYAVPTTDPHDRRAKPLVVTAEPLAMLYRWAVTHLVTLDGLDGGQRLKAMEAIPEAFAHLEIEIAASVLTTASIREPQNTVSLFTWLHNGGVIMDWLITSLHEISEDGQRYVTSITSIGEIASWIKLSRTHLTRKLREAEAMGSMGWTAKRGDSAMWVSSAFICEVIAYQAAKLAIIDAACERAFKP